MPKALTYNVAVNSRTGSPRQVGKQKGQAQNAVASMAYALGQTLYDEQEQDPSKQRKSYKGKDEVTHREIIAPEGAPEWVFNPQELANRVERSETRKNSQLMRSHILALPNDLDHEARLSICRDFAQSLADTGQVVAFAMHDAPGNKHAHFLSTMRELDENGPEGFSKHKQRDWNDYQKPGKEKTAPNLIDQRREWLEERVNRELEKAGSSTRVIYTSYEANGIDKEPTKHIGPAAGNLEKDGIESDRGTENIRKVKQKNAVKDAVRGERSEAEFGDAAIKLDKGRKRQERPEREPRERRADEGVRGERTEAEFGDAGIKLDRERQRQEREAERHKHRNAVKQSRQGARQWERARIKDEAAPQHDTSYHAARALQAKYLNQAWRAWRHGETGVTTARNAETRAKLAAREPFRGEKPAEETKQTHNAAVMAVLRSSFRRSGQHIATVINRVRSYLERGDAGAPEPERTPPGGRGSVFDALKRARGSDSHLETARSDQGERERTREYER